MFGSLEKGGCCPREVRHEVDALFKLFADLDAAIRANALRAVIAEAQRRLEEAARADEEEEAAEAWLRSRRGL